MNDSALRLLIVEDHKALAENLFEFFGYDPRYVLDFAPDGFTALNLVAANNYDVIILDVMLPGQSGYEVCRRLRDEKGCTTPVIMVSAKDQLRDKESGFGAGADDYLVKPFNLRELQLRVEALTRRKTLSRQTRPVTIPGLSYDPGTLAVSIQGQGSMSLSGTAATVFEALLRSYPDFVSYEKLSDTVWGERQADRHTLRTHVYSLRKALQQQFNRTLIRTVHGRGYQILAPDETDT
jgi:DNA-binding response OmpR family regulator